MSKKFQSSGKYLRTCECYAPDRSELYLASVAVEYPPVLVSTLDAKEWEQIFAAKDRRVPVSLIDHNFAQISNALCHDEVPLSEEAAQAIQFYQHAIRCIIFLTGALSRWDEYEVFPLKGHTVLVPRLALNAATNIPVIGEVLSKKTMARMLAGIKRTSKPRKRTPELTAEAARLFHRRHERLRAAARDYTRHKTSAAWPGHVALDDKKRPGTPKIPMVRISQLPDHSPREIALEWAAETLNERHPELGATANTIRNFLRTAQRKSR